jgi:hypothetical protein
MSAVEQLYEPPQFKRSRTRRIPSGVEILTPGQHCSHQAAEEL